MILSFRFFVIVFLSVIIYWFLPRQCLRNLVIISASFIFIFLTDIKSGIFIFLLTLFTYGWAFLLKNEKNKKLFHRIGVTILVLTLFGFKYLLFASKTINFSAGLIGIKSTLSFENLFIPLGVSYTIFKYISYLSDIYGGISSRGKLIEFFAYGSLFTIFISGPIERFRLFQPQIVEKIEFSWGNISSGAKRIIIGLFKKAVIANWVAFIISPHLETIKSLDLLFAFLILVGFSIQIYADFSGYSDIAIGASKLFGYKISENFNYAYFQNNISMFWQNWHMTLSSWIRDYLFMPLMMFFKSKILSIIFVPLIVMGICGFWHGAELKYIMWGLMHGAGIMIYQIWKTYLKRKFKYHLKGNAKKVAGIIITYIYVTLAWFWFI